MDGHKSKKQRVHERPSTQVVTPRANKNKKRRVNERPATQVVTRARTAALSTEKASVATAEDKPAKEELKLGHHEVERIVAKRVIKKKTQYLVKWAGLSDFDNSWESVGPGLNCPELIKEFQNTCRLERREDIKFERNRDRKNDPTKLEGIADTAGTVQGFGRGLPLEEFCGAVIPKPGAVGAAMVLCRWRHCDEFDFVPFETAFQHEPAKVLAYLEARIKGEVD